MKKSNARSLTNQVNEVIRVARFYVHVTDGLCAAFDKASIVTGASRSRVLAILLRIHIQELIGFLGDRLDTVEGGDDVVMVDERRDRGDALVLDANANSVQELDLLIRALGLTNPPNC
jgi:hypothetical protein